MADAFPHIDFRREVTVGHLLADCDTAHGLGGKVNPPLRPREDVEALWEHLLDGNVDWVVSDHACCRDETKFGDPRDDVFLAKSGFGGAEYLLPGMVSEGRKRGLSYAPDRRARRTNPAQPLRPRTKGAIAVGLRRRPRAGRRRRRLDGACRGVGVDPGVHAVRGRSS